jgi:hypothetical protein
MIVGQNGKPSLNELSHHGVKGMRWGVLRRSSSTSAPSGPSKKEVRQQKNTARNVEIDKARAAVEKRKQEERMAMQVKSGHERMAHIMVGIGSIAAVAAFAALSAHQDMKGL